MELFVEYIRQWKVGDKTFDSKAEAQRYETVTRLDQVTGDHKVTTSLIDHADEVIDLLKPFATPKTRAPKGNGKAKAKSEAKSAQATV